MKIGIVTQPLYDNYGALLQNWALQQVLLKLGHQPITIDYLPKQSFVRHLFSCLLSILRYQFKFRRRKFPQKELVRNKEFERFVTQYINKTDVCHKYKNYIIKKYGIEAIIVGSDQVWRPVYNGRVLYDMFGRFARYTPLFSYAASFGVDNWEYNKRQEFVCRKLISSFKGVSVREKSAVQLCQDHFYQKAHLVLDPTLLLSDKDYSGLLKGIPAPNENYLLAYILDTNEEKMNIISSIAEKKRLYIHQISIYDKKNKSVEEWLSEFRYSKFIITDSFHGMVFSIIFKTPFLVITNKKRGASRFKSLLTTLNLADRMNTTMSDKVVDWESVDKKLADMKKTSCDYIVNTLSNC